MKTDALTKKPQISERAPNLVEINEIKDANNRNRILIEKLPIISWAVGMVDRTDDIILQYGFKPLNKNIKSSKRFQDIYKGLDTRYDHRGHFYILCDSENEAFNLSREFGNYFKSIKIKVAMFYGAFLAVDKNAECDYFATVEDVF